MSTATLDVQTADFAAMRAAWVGLLRRVLRLDHVAAIRADVRRYGAVETGRVLLGVALLGYRWHAAGYVCWVAVASVGTPYALLFCFAYVGAGCAVALDVVQVLRRSRIGRTAAVVLLAAGSVLLLGTSAHADSAHGHSTSVDFGTGSLSRDGYVASSKLTPGTTYLGHYWCNDSRHDASALAVADPLGARVTFTFGTVACAVTAQIVQVAAGGAVVDTVNASDVPAPPPPSPTPAPTAAPTPAPTTAPPASSGAVCGAGDLPPCQVAFPADAGLELGPDTVTMLGSASLALVLLSGAAVTLGLRR